MASARSLHTFVRGKQLNFSLHAGLSPCRKPQKCRLWTSTQSRNCPIKRTRKQKSKPKTTQQKQEKHTTKTKTKQRRQREVGSQPAMGITCMMTSYVSFWKWPSTRNSTEQTQNTPMGHVGGWEKQQSSMRKPGIPPARIPRSQRAAVRHDITPSHFEANTDNAGSQREWWETKKRWNGKVKQI